MEKEKNIVNGEFKFEGDYLNCKIHGKGKVYYKDELRYEDKYLYGHKAKGKFYYNGKF